MSHAHFDTTSIALVQCLFFKLNRLSVELFRMDTMVLTLKGRKMFLRTSHTIQSLVWVNIDLIVIYIYLSNLYMMCAI